MCDEQEMYRLKAVEEGWDAQSCAEYTNFLDDVNKQVADAEPPCTCYYTDVDVVENRYCEAHGRREEF